MLVVPVLPAPADRTLEEEVAEVVPVKLEPLIHQLARHTPPAVMVAMD
tara:strand:- start:96 stop:239 length:144 start_codon:yes stop_codon:yes gene_type:complete